MCWSLWIVNNDFGVYGNFVCQMFFPVLLLAIFLLTLSLFYVLNVFISGLFVVLMFLYWRVLSRFTFVLCICVILFVCMFFNFRFSILKREDKTEQTYINVILSNGKSLVFRWSKYKTYIKYWQDRKKKRSHL